jgi:hypothetical protein
MFPFLRKKTAMVSFFSVSSSYFVPIPGRVTDRSAMIWIWNSSKNKLSSSFQVNSEILQHIEATGNNPETLSAGQATDPVWQ